MPVHRQRREIYRTVGHGVIGPVRAMRVPSRQRVIHGGSGWDDFKRGFKKGFKKTLKWGSDNLGSYVPEINDINGAVPDEWDEEESNIQWKDGVITGHLVDGDKIYKIQNDATGVSRWSVQDDAGDNERVINTYDSIDAANKATKDWENNYTTQQRIGAQKRDYNAELDQKTAELQKNVQTEYANTRQTDGMMREFDRIATLTNQRKQTVDEMFNFDRTKVQPTNPTGKLLVKLVDAAANTLGNKWMKADDGRILNAIADARGAVKEAYAGMPTQAELARGYNGKFDGIRYEDAAPEDYHTISLAKAAQHQQAEQDLGYAHWNDAQYVADEYGRGLSRRKRQRRLARR